MMELTTRKKLVLCTGRTHPALAADVAANLEITLSEPNIVDFASGELRPRFSDSIRGADVFVMQTHAATEAGSVNDSIMEQLVMIDAAKRASAKRITAVCPFYGYSRQDRKSTGREPITAKLVADLLRVAGADRIVSVDLHTGQIQGFFDGPVDHLTGLPLIISYLSEHASKDLVITAPDAGRVKVAERIASHLSADIAIVYKRREKDTPNAAEALAVMGPVEGRTCVLVDDMIDTAGTICSAAELLKTQGAKEVWAAATHPIFSGPAVNRLRDSAIDQLLVTDTIPLSPHKQVPNMKILSIAGVIAEAIQAVFSDTSVSALFNGENQT